MQVTNHLSVPDTEPYFLDKVCFEESNIRYTYQIILKNYYGNKVLLGTFLIFLLANCVRN